MSDLSEGMTTAAQWRKNALADNPAGPLYVSGDYAEAEIIGDDAAAASCVTASECTGSRCSFCCI